MPRTLRSLALAFLLTGSTVLAGTHTWTGANSSLWSDPGNWTGGSPAGDANATLIFPGPVTSVDDLGVVTYTSLMYVYAGSVLTATPGSSLALAGDIQLGTGIGPSTISIPIALYGGVTHNATATGGTLTGGYGTLVLDGGLSGSDPFSVHAWLAPFEVVLGGTNGLTGAVSVYYATLEVNGSLAASTVTDGQSGRLLGSGSMAGSASVVDGGFIRAGTPAATGIFSIGGDLAFTSGTLGVRLNGTTPGTGYDQVQVSGSSFIQASGGSLHLDVTAGFVPPVGTVFTVIQGAGPLSGAGFPTDPVYTANCLAFQASQTATSVLLTRIAGGPPLGGVTISSSSGQSTYCNGTGGTATAADAGGCANSHQWGYRTTSGGAITDISGQTGASYVISGDDFPGPGTYFLIETTTPTDNTAMTSNELTITVLGPAAGTASATTTICAGQSTQLHATGGTGCSWSPITGLSDSSSCDPVAAPSATTTYTVTFSGVCAAANQPSVTVTVLPLPATKFHTITPCRAVDTRAPNGPLAGPSLTPWQTRSFPLTTACGVPSTATALAANVTVVFPGSAGDLRVYAANVAQPLASTINFKHDDIRANNALVELPCDGSGFVDVVNESVGETDILIDVAGYFE